MGPPSSSTAVAERASTLKSLAVDFKPRAPREDVNVSPTHPLKEAALLVVATSLLFALAVGLIASGVDLVVMLVSPRAESRVFRSLGAELAAKTVEDGFAEPAKRLQGLLDRLASHWPEAPYQFRVGITRSEDPNALALPGGLILVSSALLERAESENELAFVLGHELGHFRGRHHLRRLGRSVVWGMALAVVVGSAQTAPDLATLSGSLAARGFDRDHERQADRFGLELVQAEYGHVAGARRFFERLEREAPPGANLTVYLSTHPSSHHRIEELEVFARERGFALDGELTPKP